ncbi:hypothetical protein V8C35DRAFT_286560 [Trichoderma chlorosporum]
MGAVGHVRLAWAALAASLMTAMGDKSAITYPAIFEVDLLFPRNETYAPTPLMPVVFAVQNPTLAKPLDATIKWTMWEGNDKHSPGSVTGGHIDVGVDVTTESKPSNDLLLLSSAVNTVAYPDGFWTLAWYLEYNNCSLTPSQGETFYTVFTVSKSGKAPDLVAATSAGTCSTTEAQGLNVTSLDGCGNLEPSPTTNPCAATIDSAAASSLSAEARATGYICASNSNLTCPTSFPPLASAGNSRMATSSALLTLLVALTALVHLG